jgi:hypothetical protein
VWDNRVLQHYAVRYVGQFALSLSLSANPNPNPNSNRTVFCAFFLVFHQPY